MKKLLYSTGIVLTVLLVAWGVTLETRGIPVQLSEHRYEMNPLMPSALYLMNNAGVVSGLTMAFVQTGVSGLGNANSGVTGTYVASQIDTFIFNREKGISALAFAVHFKDSVLLFATGGIAFKRIVDGVICQVPTAVDTVTGSGGFFGVVDGDAYRPWVNGVGITGALTLAPLADQYWAIVKYAATLNATGGVPGYKAEFIKTYSQN